MGAIRNVRRATGFCLLAASAWGCATETEEPPPEGPEIDAHKTEVVGCCGAGGAADPTMNGLRLTLESGVAVPVGDVTGTQLRVAPHTSATIALYDGSAWVARTADPLPTATSAAANANQHVFAYWNATQVALELVPWNGTPDAQIALQDGVQVKAGDPTRRYIGAVASDASGVFSDSQQKRLVWNRDNQVPRPISVLGSGGWFYNNANGVWREAAGGTSYRVGVLAGVVNGGATYLSVKAQAMGHPTNITQGWVATGIGIDSSTVTSAQYGSLALGLSSGQYGHVTATYEGYLTAGTHTVRWLETGNGSGANYFFLGTPSSPAFGRLGMSGWVLM